MNYYNDQVNHHNNPRNRLIDKLLFIDLKKNHMTHFYEFFIVIQPLMSHMADELQ